MRYVRGSTPRRPVGTDPPRSKCCLAVARLGGARPSPRLTSGGARRRRPARYLRALCRNRPPRRGDATGRSGAAGIGIRWIVPGIAPGTRPPRDHFRIVVRRRGMLSAVRERARRDRMSTAMASLAEPRPSSSPLRVVLAALTSRRARRGRCLLSRIASHRDRVDRILLPVLELTLECVPDRTHERALIVPGKDRPDRVGCTGPGENLLQVSWLGGRAE